MISDQSEALMELLEEQALGCRSQADKAQPRRVCFVCTGNTCRSPMAQAYANARLSELGRVDLRVYSAGLFALDGEPITPYAVQALEENGIPYVSGSDYRRHVAHTLTADEAEAFDLFVGMTDGHAMQLMLRFPQAAERITAMPTPIADPYGGDAEAYLSCLDQIRAGVDALLFSEAAE